MTTTRRTALALLGGASFAGLSGAAGCATPASSASNPADSPMTSTSGVIDTHHHMVPAFYVEAVGADLIGAVTPTRRAPDWTPQLDLEMMDRSGIAKAVLSASPGLLHITGERAISICQRLNAYGAELVAARPTRYGQFAILPLPDINASLIELARAMDDVKADGVVLFTNYAGRYLGDALFEPLYQELNRRNAVVFVHPTIVPYQVTDIPASVLEFPFDTTRTIASLIYRGVTQRFPNIKFIFSHAGGAAPFLAGRMDGPTRLDPRLAEILPNGVMPELRKLYWDTALSANPSALAALLTITDSSHVLFGSDFPFAPAPIAQMSVQALSATLNPADLANVLSGSARALIPSIA